MTKTIKLFDRELISKLSVFKDYGYAGGAGLVWNKDLMDKNNKLILKIIHKKLDGKVLVMSNDIIYLSVRVTSYGIIRNIEWSKEYKTCFRIEYSRICLKVRDTPCIRIMEDNSTYVNPNSSYSVITRGELDKLIDKTLADIKKKLIQ